MPGRRTTSKTPANGGRYKFFTGKHWTVTHADPESGKVNFHHGGTYTLDGDTYEETILYSIKDNAGLIKQVFKFKVKVEGDTYTQIGVGNPYSEVSKHEVEHNLHPGRVPAD